MTERLYYDNAYLTEFSAVVTACEPCEGGFAVHLNRSAFYPTSGGQPYDEGTIGDAVIRDVSVEADGDVVHVVDRALTAGSEVFCKINWERRFDHMQQHAGDHMLAGCLYRTFRGHTIGLHIGHADSSIDVEFPDGRTHLTAEEIDALEDMVNGIIQKDVPIKCWFPDKEELASLPLRKAPTVDSHIRVVQIGDDEFCACGGTHPSTSGQVGLFKLTDVRPSRGKIRFTFVAGMRAVRLFRAQMKAFDKVNALLSSDINTAVSAAETVLSRLKDTEYHLQQEKNARAMEKADAAAETAPVIGSVRVVKLLLDGVDGNTLKDTALHIIASPGRIALTGSRTESGVQLLYTRSADVETAMGALLASSVKPFGGKGGGRPDFAGGSCPTEEALDRAMAILEGK